MAVPNSSSFPQNSANVLSTTNSNQSNSSTSVTSGTPNNSSVSLSQSNVNYSTPPSTPYQAIPSSNVNAVTKGSNLPWNVPLTPFGFGNSQLFVNVPSTPTFSNGYWTGSATPNETEYDQYPGENVLSGVSTNSNQENTNENEANDSDENIQLDNGSQDNNPTSDRSEGEIAYNLDEEVALEREKEETEAESFPIQLNNEEDSYALEDIKPVSRNQRETRRMRASSQAEKTRRGSITESTDEATALLQISDLLQTKPRTSRRK